MTIENEIMNIDLAFNRNSLINAVVDKIIGQYPK